MVGAISSPDFNCDPVLLPAILSSPITFPECFSMTLRRLALFVLVSCSIFGFARAADWARLRGPNGAGVVSEATPVKFTAKDQLWKTPIAGTGHGSPIIVGDRVFLQASSNDDSKRSLICLSAMTGKIEWTKEIGGQKAPIHKKNTMASSTPASDGERVFATVWDGAALSLYAYDLAGKELWNASLGSYAAQHGAAHSPMVFGGLVYMNVDSDSSAKLVAYDAVKGTETWKVDRVKERASYTTPMVLEEKDKPAQLILGTTTTVDSYDPKTGKSNWSYAIVWPAGKKLRAVGQPILAAGNIVTYMGEGGSGRYMVAVKTDGTGTLGAKGKAWDSNEKERTPYVPSVLTHGEHLYWINDTGFAACADAKTGKIIWYARAFPKGVSSSPILVNGTILAFDEAGKAVAFQASPKEFESVAESSLGEAVFSSPAAAGGRLFVRGTQNLYCFGPKGS